MLAKSYKTGAELGIAEVERDALISILHQIERGEMKIKTKHRGSCLLHASELSKDLIYMPKWFTQGGCGTVGCLAGTAHLQTQGEAFPELASALREDGAQLAVTDMDVFMRRIPACLFNLFTSYCTPPDIIESSLRSFLTTGTI